MGIGCGEQKVGMWSKHMQEVAHRQAEICFALSDEGISVPFAGKDVANQAFNESANALARFAVRFALRGR